MHLANRIERTTESRYILETGGPTAANYWSEYRDFAAMLSEQHSMALFLAEQAKERGDTDRRFQTDVPQRTLDSFIITAPTILRKMDKDIQSIINQGGCDAIIYMKTLSTLRTALTETISFATRLVGA